MTDDTVQQLSSGVTAIEGDISKNLVAGANAVPTQGAVASQIHDVQSHCNDAANRIRCCNLLLYGIRDDSNEPWNVPPQCSLELTLLQTSSKECIA